MANRINSTKIFISSTAQANLQTLRTTLRDKLKEAGHLPLLFEEDFGLWTDDSLEDCLDKVRESQIYVLFISDKKGSFTTIDPNVTATYAEFITAFKEKKIIIPFVEQHIFDFYNEHIKLPLMRKINKYQETHERKPDYTYDIVKEFIKEEKQLRTPLSERIEDMRVDDFNWAFIHDVYLKTNWTYSSTLVETNKTCDFITVALSQVLKNIAPYYPLKNHIEYSLHMADRFTQYKKAIPDFLQCIRKGKLNTKQIITTLSHYLKGGRISHNQSPFGSEPVATVSDCLGITLYKNVKDHLEIEEFSGSITPSKVYMLNDTDSFVAITYQANREEVENIFYNKEKQQIYMTKKFGLLVLSAHFSLSEPWSEKKVRSYENQILSAIMKERDQFDFAIDLIGGMLNE